MRLYKFICKNVLLKIQPFKANYPSGLYRFGWPPFKLFFENADLLIAADCAAYSYGNFHHDFIKGKVTLIGCPKLDSEDYSEKLSQILKAHTIKSITVTRMEVPCCGGMEVAVKKAIQISGKDIPCQIVVISTTGIILSR